MNRLRHLKKTFLQNIRDNHTYPNIEFVLLNYNSKDSMDQWVFNELKEYIDTGILNYYSTREPKYFQRSHSRNMTFRLAKGDIICNIDADNFTGKNFAYYVNNCFVNNKNVFLSGHGSSFSSKDTCGKICMLNEDFWLTGGFDERISDYGWEDIDLILRLKRIGRKAMPIQKKEYLQVIKHSDVYRLRNEKAFNSYNSIYIRYISPVRSQILILFKDKSFSLGNLVLRVKLQKTVLEKDWIYGTWYRKDYVNLNFNSGHTRKLCFSKDDLVKDLNLFYKINDKHLMAMLKILIPAITNKRIMQKNINQKIIKVNKNGFGKGKVIKNFNKLIKLDDT